jgi:hypothetical protein
MDSLDREPLRTSGLDVVYRLRRRHRTGFLHTLRYVWHHESYALVTGLHAVAVSIGITR